MNLTGRWWFGGLLRVNVPFWDEHCRERIENDGSQKLNCDPVDELDAEDRDELPDVLWYLGVTGRVDFR